MILAAFVIPGIAVLLGILGFAFLLFLGDLINRSGEDSSTPDKLACPTCGDIEDWCPDC